MKKKVSILVGFTFLILLLLPTIIVYENNIINDNTINEKHYKEDSITTLKTSGWNPGFNYSMNVNAAYNWIEINETGKLMKRISDDDDGAESINLTADGWDFTFYGTKYTNITVNTNGWMTCTREGDPTNYDFDYAYSYAWEYIPQNCSLSGYENHNDSILVYATDLRPEKGGLDGCNIYYEFRGSPGNRFLVIEFDRVAEFSTDLNQTFQAIIYQNGDLKFQYKKTTETSSFNYEDVVAGLDHGDLINYNNITYDFWHGIKEKAIYFRLNKTPLPPPLPTPDNDDDDDEEGIIPFSHLFILFMILGVIGLVFHKRRKIQ